MDAQNASGVNSPGMKRTARKRQWSAFIQSLARLAISEVILKRVRETNPRRNYHVASARGLLLLIVRGQRLHLYASGFR